MIKVEDKEQCSGCSACCQVCPKECITMQADEEGLLYPSVNQNLCVNCHRCEHVCPILEGVIEKDEPLTYAGYNKCENEREVSSSGGIFTLIAKYIIEQGGVVFGAAFNESFEVEHIRVERSEELSKLRGSKYVQSRVGNIYKEVQEFLNNERIVLFTGTPCQIGGLLSYLTKEYKNLYTQDIVCHGVPSPMVWSRYVKYRKKSASSSIDNITFRSKNNGWANYHVQFEFSNNTKYSQVHTSDLYLRAFLRKLTLRPSCYACHFKGTRRVADITLGDFWGIENVVPELDDNKGTSLVLCNTEKGKQLFDNICSQVEYCEVDYVEAMRYNPAAIHSVKQPGSRDIFMKAIRHGRFDKCVEIYCNEEGKYDKWIQFREDIESVKRDKGAVFATVWSVKNFGKTLISKNKRL